MHRTPVRSLVWEDPARSRATKPLRHKDRAHELQLLKSKHPKAHALTRAAAAAAVTSVVSDSVRPHRRQPTRLLCPWGLQARILEWVAISFSTETREATSMRSLSTITGEYPQLSTTSESPHTATKIQCSQLKKIEDIV